MEESEEVDHIDEKNAYCEDKENNEDYGDDSEEEVILAGSELYKYLQSCQNEEIEAYNPSNEQCSDLTTCLQLPQPSHNLVLPDCLEFINKILHSKLLLEEDATYLFNVTSELIPHKKSFMNSKKWSIGVGILEAISTYLFVKVKKLRAPMVLFITGSTVLLVSMLNRVLTKSAFDKKLHSLLDVLQKTFTVTRKIITVISEDDSYLSTKERVKHLQRSHEDILKEHTFKRKLTEISVLTDRTAIALKNLITIARKATVSLIKLREDHRYEHEDYIAFYSNEELGLERIFNHTERPHNLASLHSLKNIYLLMQSECLRLLGICFCRTSSYDDISNIFKVVNTYMSESSYTLEILEIEYTKYVFPLYNKKDQSVSKTAPREEQLLIHDISRSLNGLLIEMRELEMLLDSDDNLPGFDFIVSRINELEDEFTSVLEIFKNVKKHFTKYLINRNVDSSPNELCTKTEKNTNLTQTDIMVGFSDFSIKGPDEVFLGSSDGTQNSSNEEYDDFNQFKPPVSLIKELKVALVKKREEFEQREMKSLKCVDDIEAYKACLADQNSLTTNATQGSSFIESQHSEEDSKSLEAIETLQLSNATQNNPLPNNETVDSPSMINEIDEGSSVDINNCLFSKNIALAATNRSMAWSSMKSTDYFEDTDSD